MMKFSENPDYGFAIGRVRTKEQFLIRRNDYERMTTINNQSELVTQVKGIWRIEISESISFDSLLETGTKENHDFFIRYCADPLVKYLFINPANKNLKNIAATLKRLDSEFLSLYFTTIIDLENIRNFIRIKNLASREKQDPVIQKKRFSEIYLKNGIIPISNFSELFTDDWNATIQWAGKTKYQTIIEQSINYLLTQKSFIRLERLIEEEKQKILTRTRYATFGFEPLVAYYLFKENEIRNLRKIYFGITEKTAVEQIKESIACVL